MTSRVSFTKFYRETLKHHLTPLLITAFTFIVHFITVFMNLQNLMEAASYTLDAEYIYEQIVKIYSPGITNGIFALLMGIYLAYDFYKYLHSKKETDFYESLPIRKSTRFAVHFICAFSIFSFFSFVALGMELLVVNIYGFGSVKIASAVIWNFFCMNGVFLASFSTAVLAMVMTGHSIVAMLGYGVFASYLPVIINLLVPSFADNYFSTFTSLPSFGNISIEQFLYYFSPASLMYKLNNYWSRAWDAAEHMSYFVVVWIFALVIGFTAYLLFVRRPSEAAGRAMAFEKANRVIRILLVVPLSLYLGLFLRSMSVYTSEAWLVFGILFGGFIIHGVIEAIFEFDIRAIFTKKRQLLLSYILCFVFMFIFWTDFLNFNEYLPAEKDVEVVEIGGMDDYYFEFDGDGISGENLELALKAADELIDAHLFIEAKEGITRDAIVVTYQLKNGLNVSRRYMFDTSNIPASLDALSMTEDYKDDIHMLYTYPEDTFETLSIYNGLESDTLYVTGDSVKELLAVYKEDYTNLSLTRYYNEPVLFEIAGEYPVEGSTYKNSICFYVYEGFERTIAKLEELEMIPFHERSDIQITKIEVHGYKYDTENKFIEDVEIIKKLKPHMYINNFNYHMYDEEWVYCTITTDTAQIYHDIRINVDVLEEILD